MCGAFRADGGTRTPDPFITSEVLYQLSYVGIVLSPGPCYRPSLWADRREQGRLAALGALGYEIDQPGW